MYLGALIGNPVAVQSVLSGVLCNVKNSGFRILSLEITAVMYTGLFFSILI